MKKIYSIFIAILLVLTIELLDWEALPGSSQDVSDNFTATAVAAPNNQIRELNFGFGFDPYFHFINNHADSSKPTNPVLDPVSILLLGSGLVGLAGLGRKKFMQ